MLDSLGLRFHAEVSNLVSEINGLLWICEIRSLEVFIIHTSKEPKCQKYRPRRLWHCSKYTGKRKRGSDPVEPLMCSTFYRFQKDQGVEAWRSLGKIPGALQKRLQTKERQEVSHAKGSHQPLLGSALLMSLVQTRWFAWTSNLKSQTVLQWSGQKWGNSEQDCTESYE